MAILDHTAEPTSAEKFARQLVAYFSSSRAGQLVLDALADDVTEVYLNSDRKLWKDTYSAGAGRYGAGTGTGASATRAVGWDFT